MAWFSCRACDVMVNIYRKRGWIPTPPAPGCPYCQRKMVDDDARIGSTTPGETAN